MDGTLVNLRPAVRAAQQAVLAELHEMTAAAAELTVADLDAEWEAEFERRRSQPAELIRRAALSRSLARVGLPAELDRVPDLFFARRFAATRLYNGVPELFAELRNSYVLGFATNGNSHASRVGLAGESAFEVCEHVHDLAEPRRRGPSAARPGLPPGCGDLLPQRTRTRSEGGGRRAPPSQFRRNWCLRRLGNASSAGTGMILRHGVIHRSRSYPHVVAYRLA